MSSWMSEGLQSPADSEFRRKLMDQFVSDAAYGCFMRTTDPFNDPLPLRNPHNLTRYLPEGISHKELGIINLTAIFMAVYGVFFQRALFKKVIMDPRFQFMTKPPDDINHSSYGRLSAGYLPTDNSKHSFYCRLFLGYMAVLKPCQVLTKNAGASPQTVLDGFFDLLAQLEKQEGEGVEKVGTVDMHAFEFLAESLCERMPLPLGHHSNMLHPWSSQMAELLTTQSDGMPEDSHEKIRALGIEMSDVSSRRTWRSSVSYHACYQQMQILSQAFYEELPPSPQPKDLQNNSDQSPADLGCPGISVLSYPPPPKFTALIPEGITCKELGIMKLTAQFAVVYGLYFRDDLEKRVSEDPRFEFLKPTDSRYPFYSELSCGYERVLIPSRKKSEVLIPLRKMSGAPSAETVLEGFWNFVEMLEEGVDMDMINLHVFEYFANKEDQELNLPREYLSMMMYPLVPPFGHVEVQIPHDQSPQPPRPEDLNPKRLKISSKPVVRDSSL